MRHTGGLRAAQARGSFRRGLSAGAGPTIGAFFFAPEKKRGRSQFRAHSATDVAPEEAKSGLTIS